MYNSELIKDVDFADLDNLRSNGILVEMEYEKACSYIMERVFNHV